MPARRAIRCESRLLSIIAVSLSRRLCDEHCIFFKFYFVFTCVIRPARNTLLIKLIVQATLLSSFPRYMLQLLLKGVALQLAGTLGTCKLDHGHTAAMLIHVATISMIDMAYTQIREDG